MPLRRGHLAVLIAAGFLNNILLEAAGRRVLVKGRTYKETIPVESDDPDVEIEREVCDGVDSIPVVADELTRACCKRSSVSSQRNCGIEAGFRWAIVDKVTAAARRSR